jgi:hypothetical protein
VQDFDLPAVPVPASHVPSTAPPSTAQYLYRVVPLPRPTAQADDAARAAAGCLERLIGQKAAEGWDFFRLDTIPVKVPPGCLGLLSGHKTAEWSCNVVTFRKPNPSWQAAPNQANESI